MATQLHDLPARFRAIQYFQERQRSADPSSNFFKVAETATDYALGETRSIGQHLARNLIRDAKKAVIRDLAVKPPIEFGNGNPLDDVYPTGTEEVLSPDCPESHYSAQEISSRILSSGIGDREILSKIFEDMVAGLTAEESARELNIGASRVAQYRKKVRAYTSELLSINIKNN